MVRTSAALVELLKIPLDRAEAETVGRGAIGSDSGAPHLVEGGGGGDSFLSSEVVSSDDGFEGVKIRAAALGRDPVKSAEGVYWAEASFELLGNERDGAPAN